MDEPKNNRCEIIFKCGHLFGDPCAYYKTSEGVAKCEHCKGNMMHICMSPVANVNRMILEAELMGVKLEAKGKS